MSTYEKVLRETGRYEVMDAQDRSHVVVEHTSFLHRVSVTKHYPPVRGELRFSLLEDGARLKRTLSGHFDSEDGTRRFFIVRRMQSPRDGGDGGWAGISDGAVTRE